MIPWTTVAERERSRAPFFVWQYRPHKLYYIIMRSLSLLLLAAAAISVESFTTDNNARRHLASSDKENEFRFLLERMEADVLSFRDEIERVYASRCDAATLSACSKSNYNDCSSTYPNQQCMKADELVIESCGDGTACNALWDKTQTAVRIPGKLAQAPNDNPTDPQVIESVCYTHLAEPYMIANYQTGNQMYYGSDTGSFRIIPARHSEKCGVYDPRRRPWYVAASSGPKDVVLVLDVSGSMEDYGRIKLAKEASSTIVDTLTVADRVAIVKFSDVASLIGGQTSLIRATKENKKLLIDAIDGLEAEGATNFYDAFDKAFDAIDKTIRAEQTTGCNIALLFMTDGQITQGPGEDDVINLVNDRTGQLATNFNRKTTIFTFSLGDLADHTVTKSIACNTDGIWTLVDDFADDLVDEMSSYYKLYALGLGEGDNDDFVSWVEPYEFHSGGKMGTSVSTPVYDRSVSPPLFLGVAAVDMPMDDVEQILGEEASSSNMLDRFVLLSTARCPKIELTEYELDALRFLGGGEEATCGASNATTGTSYAGVVPEKCATQSDYPNNMWENTDMAGKEYVDRACCESNGGVVPSDSCPDLTATTETATTKAEEESSSGSNTGMIVGIVVGVLAAVIIGASAFVWHKKKGEPRRSINRLPSSINEAMSSIPVPSAPSAPPAFNPAAN